jgi:hypothetical protein
MFANVSMAGVGQVAVVVSFVLNWLGIDIGDQSVEGALNGALMFFGLVWTVYGQLRRSDLVLGLFRK